MPVPKERSPGTELKQAIASQVNLFLEELLLFGADGWIALRDSSSIFPPAVPTRRHRHSPRRSQPAYPAKAILNGGQTVMLVLVE
jgi:hypothetical protein